MGFASIATKGRTVYRIPISVAVADEYCFPNTEMYGRTPDKEPNQRK